MKKLKPVSQLILESVKPMSWNEIARTLMEKKKVNIGDYTIEAIEKEPGSDLSYDHIEVMHPSFKKPSRYVSLANVVKQYGFSKEDFIKALESDTKDE